MYSGLRYLSQPVVGYRSNYNELSGGFPHSDIHGSKPIPGSPWLNAGYHVLHRLLLPRHPPNALFALDLIQKEQGSLRQMLSTFPPRSWFVIAACLVSVLDLDNVACPCGRHPPTRECHNIDCCISLNDVKCVRLDDQTHRDALDDQTEEELVEPDGVEPTTSCLQSRRSTN